MGQTLVVWNAAAVPVEHRQVPDEARRDRWMGDLFATGVRLRALAGLMADLRVLGRGSHLVVPGDGEGEPYLRALVAPGRVVSVLVAQMGRGRWRFVWQREGRGFSSRAECPMQAALHLVRGSER